tara:strand:- start:4470 stop:5504 length:1035 start_codon:yes stop_codon:yes gene_type:complete
LNIENYNFNLPEDLIANQPSIKRSDSKLLVVQENLIDEKFKSIINYLKEGDLLVLNDTKVFNARLTANKQTGGKVEILLERQLNEFTASAITKTNRPLKENEILQISDSDVTAVVVEKNDYLCKIEFSRDLETIIDTYGTIPIPPYMNRESNIMDQERYQTVYANDKKRRSSAAPTAGLHFDKSLLSDIESKGIEITNITLDIGLGTFKPISQNDYTKHTMHSEKIYLSEQTSELINRKIRSKSKIISVGTTTLRCLEAVYKKLGKIQPYEGDTDIFIYPGFSFEVVDSLITNFHLPKSTLLLLVSAFAGEIAIKSAYDHAIENRYRFYSYGDSMLLNRKNWNP